MSMGFLVYAYSRTSARAPDIEKRVYYEEDAIGTAKGLQKSGKYTHIGVVRLHSVALWEWEQSWPSAIVRK